MPADNSKRLHALEECFHAVWREKALILVNHCEDVDAGFGFLWSQSPPIPTGEVHGLVPSTWRKQAISSFKRGHIYFLVATIGICWRGQNFKGVQRLIFFTLP